MRSAASLLVAFIFVTTIVSSRAFAEANKESTATANKNLEANKGNISGLQTDAPTSASELNEATDSCKQALDAARQACLESMNGSQDIMAALGPALQALAGSTGSSGKCEEAQKSNEDAQKGMQQVSAACQQAQSDCVSSCQQSEGAAGKTAQATCQQDAQKQAAGNQQKQSQIMQKCSQVASTTKQKLNENVRACQSLGQNQQGNLAALAGLAANIMQAKKCKEDVCKANPEDPSCKQKLDCNLASNDANPQCICEKNPRMCAGNNAQDLTDPNREDGSSGDDGYNDSPVAGAPENKGIDGGSSGGGSGLGVSGGTDGGGSLGGGNPSKGKAAADKPAGSILNGFEGGSGGGSKVGGGRVDPKEGPGGGGRFPTTVDDLKKQVTGSYGKTVWQKMNDAYVGQGSSFLRGR